MKPYFSFIVVIFYLTSCTSTSPKSEGLTSDSNALVDEVPTIKTEIEVAYIDEGDGLGDEPEEGEEQENGVFQSVNESGDGSYSITIAYPNQDEEKVLELNLKETSMTKASLQSLLDSKVTFNFKSDLEMVADDVLLEGKSLLGELYKENNIAEQRVTGVLNLGKNLPRNNEMGIITLLHNTGELINLKSAISADLIKAYGKEITVSFSLKVLI
jgi:hypothetical protein